LYARAIDPFLASRRRAWALVAVTLGLFLSAAALAAVRAVPLKMLPFDNKNELQVVIDPPEGVSLERTDAIARRLGEVALRAPEVTDVAVWSGLASPMDFNGMVRHYFLRRGPNVAELRLNLLPKRRREMQSHDLALRLRRDLEAVASEEGARIAIVEVPPGPPVLSTVTAELYGEAGTPYERVREAALVLARRLRREPGAADVDTSVEDDDTRYVFVTDQEKAALSGVSADDVARTVALAIGGLDVSSLHVPGEMHPLPIRLRLSREDRSGIDALRALAVKGRPGIAVVREDGGVREAPIPIVRLGEIGHFERRPVDRAIYHKNLERMALVYAEAVGRPPAELVADLAADLESGDGTPAGAVDAESAPRPLGRRTYLDSGGGIPWSLPAGTRVEWFGEGELNITRDVFRDLGIAFAIALVGIYGILVYQTRSYAMPLVLMISIPLTMIGIMPGFALLGAVGGGPVAGYETPVFFTATAMIGMIALAGIAVRNAILLIEFLHIALGRGLSLREAILQAGAVRTRPILLTAGTAMLAAVPITLDRSRLGAHLRPAGLDGVHAGGRADRVRPRLPSPARTRASRRSARARRRVVKRRVRRGLEAVAGIATIAAAVVWLSGGCGERVAPGEVERHAPAAGGPSAVVESITSPSLEWASGAVDSARRTSIAPRILARIEEVRVRAGSEVARDDLLVKLDARDLDARVREGEEALRGARAQLELARAEAKGVATQQRVDQVRSELRVAEAEEERLAQSLAEARTALSFTEIRSPVAGRVVDRLAEPGDTAVPGRTLLRIYDPSALRVEVPVRETLAVRLDVGDALRVEVPAVEIQVEGVVDEIVPFAEPGARTLLVKVRLPPRPGLFAGMFARVAIPADARTRLVVPDASIERVGQLEFATVLGEGGAATRRLVTTGRRLSPDRVEVLSGLADGERVAVAP
jgi:RND family efflux transporter MFP subunit